jgi:acetylornithine deacetylase
LSDTIVIKVGGGILLDPTATEQLVAGVDALSKEQRVVIVHGGGPQATSMAERVGHQPRIVNGRRVTSDLDLELILSTVCGVVNSQLVAKLAACGIQAVGINGASAGLVHATRRPPWMIDGEQVDFGHVGDIEEIRPAPIRALTESGFVPVIATVGATSEGELLNINADTTAVAVAEAVGAQKLFMVTGTGGLIHEGDVLSLCDEGVIETGLSEGWITEGMQVKLSTAMKASRAGVDLVAVIGPDALTDPRAGTQIVSALVDYRPSPASADSPGVEPVELLKTMIRFKSVTGQETEIANWVEDWSRSQGLKTARFEDNVYCWIGDGPNCLLLNSHLDVVPPSADHPFDPFDPIQQDNHIYGRGAVDAKASGAAMLSTIGRLASEGWYPKNGRLLLALTACEEGTGAYNGLETLLPHLPPLSGAIVGEPTELQPCVSQKGLLILKLTAKGRSAHAARAHLGENAIEKAARDINRLEDFTFERIHPELGPVSLAVTTISGGSARNVVPDECSFFVDIRTTPAYTHEELIELLSAQLECDISVHSGRYEPKATPSGSRIEQSVISTIPGASPFGSPTVSDWAFLGSVPAVKLGPGDSNLSHTGAERILVDEVIKAAEVYSSCVKAFFDEEFSESDTFHVEASHV